MVDFSLKSYYKINDLGAGRPGKRPGIDGRFLIKVLLRNQRFDRRAVRRTAGGRRAAGAGHGLSKSGHGVEARRKRMKKNKNEDSKSNQASLSDSKPSRHWLNDIKYFVFSAT